MKKIIFILMILPFSFMLSSQGQYNEAMNKGMELLQKSNEKDQFLNAANHFERVAQVEKEKWLPGYYAAFAKAMAATQLSDPDAIEEMLDGAQVSLDGASAIDKSNSEINALQGFIHMLRIAVDPMIRGQQYSGMSAASLQKARSLNPKNPRAIHLLAQLSFGTAQFLGSGTAEACQLNENALALFDAEESAKADASFDPSWVKEMAESFKKQCVN